MKTKEEIEILRADAIAGDAGAQNDLGCAYSSGDGVVKNLKEAFMWFERSAKQGNKYGQYNIGRNYQYGFGTTKNIQLAIEWYEKAADQGFGKAANMLGDIYEKGYMSTLIDWQLKRDTSKGVPANHDEAFYWYSRGKNSDDQAKYNLARCYEEGIGTTISLYKACALYKECKGEDAKRRLEKIREAHNPVLYTRFKSVDIIGNNPFRVLGVWSNSPEKEIRANLSKIEIMSKVGKSANIENDHLIPCCIGDYIISYKNRIAYSEEQIQKSSDLYKKIYGSKVEVYKEILKEWELASQTTSSWSDLPNRTSENINISVQKLASGKERVKYALFWFCNYTPSDAKALNLMLEQKWDEAYEVWSNEDNFSARINKSLILWIERKDQGAIASIHKIITDDTLRTEFVSGVTSGRTKMTKEELSHLFWDALYEFPESELSLNDIMWYGSGKGSIILKHAITEEEKEYNQNKGFNILKSPIDDLLRKAGNLAENDFEKGRSAYYDIIKKAPNILLRIKRVVGEDNYRYKLLCNEIAEELLEFAIHYNNDKKDDWAAPQTALYVATSALNFAIDENLRERCEQNVDIFRQNKQILSTDKLLEEIDKKFKEIDEKSVNLSQAEKLQTDISMYVECIKTENGKESDLYKKVSDNAVNAILNVVIAICNRDKDATTAISASGLLKKLKSMDMSSETRSRLERNNSIISNNMVAAMRRGNLGDLGNSGKTYTKEENKSRRIHKAFATVCSIAAFALMWYYMSWNNNLQYFMETMPLWGYICIIFMVFIALFPIIMWGLEFQKDPHNTRLYWINNTIEKLYVISNEIIHSRVEYGRSYSWPFAIPFQLLGIAIWILSFPVKGMAKLAAMIK